MPGSSWTALTQAPKHHKAGARLNAWLRLRGCPNLPTVKIRFWAECCSRETGTVQYRAILNFWKENGTGDFDFPPKRKPAVPKYADGLRLLVFGLF